MMLFIGLLSLCLLALVEADVMNKGGIPYRISNPPGSTKNWVGESGEYSTDFVRNVKGPVEYFDVYGEVRTQYSQVYWTRNTPINLPPELVERFKGKVMAITGYEIDQVTHDGPQTGSTTKGDVLGGFACYPECNGTDTSVPSYHAYNHHYFSWLVGKDAQVYDRDKASHIPNPTRTAIRDLSKTHNYPTNIVFKENPGGEYRKSYHGYPSGFAQLIHSPDQWVVEPMQIDTHNRKYGITEQVGYKPWFLPKQQQNRMTDLESGLCPLIECPCSTRISKVNVSLPSIVATGTCKSPIASSDACLSSVRDVAAVSSFSTIDDQSKASGCAVAPDSGKPGFFKVTFNKAQSSKPCGSDGNVKALFGRADLGGLVNLSIDHDGNVANLTLSGPESVWYGIGFNAKAMNDRPYAIIVDGSGKVTERKLADHDPGTLLTPSVQVLSSTVVAGVRTVVLSRAIAGATADHYTIPTTPGLINLITAVGSGESLAYHKARTGASIVLLPSDVSSCFCAPKLSSYFVYMNQSRREFEGYDCVDEPRSDMLRHGDGTGRNVSNAACHMQTYHGGLQCCQHKFFLTDAEQAGQVPDQTDVYFLKWRYYFQEYVPASGATPASHLHLHHWVFLIDQQINDYEEDNAHYGQKSIGKIEAHLTARDMGLEDIPSTYKGITPLVMTPHCHAPSCMREELWNADTGEILCNVTVEYGKPNYGALSQVFNEKNYVAIPPCIFGHQAGLQKPFTLSPDTKLTAIKYFNNTYRHLGQMAQWTGLMVYDTDPFARRSSFFI
eukprot:TRINITY_DN9201_c0_g2_i2.p1 TRINITY_DN9201_c0_g2~~TRINITY_DN9201_c0_g2_i2.p1  ORF type:complete len:781 (-),score=80.76 TRINITY_DN9201_c0_g2_i2:119-2461(-)